MFNMFYIIYNIFYNILLRYILLRYILCLKPCYNFLSITYYPLLLYLSPEEGSQGLNSSLGFDGCLV